MTFCKVHASSVAFGETKDRLHLMWLRRSDIVFTNPHRVPFLTLFYDIFWTNRGGGFRLSSSVE
jgi:hypothetical protein